MPRLAFALVIAAPVAIGACAPAPLYTSSGLHAGAVTLGEIPRDARGEPVWAAIRPAPVMPQSAAAPSRVTAELQEGDGEAFPMPPKAE